jgi:hypothetical protein
LLLGEDDFDNRPSVTIASPRKSLSAQSVHSIQTNNAIATAANASAGKNLATALSALPGLGVLDGEVLGVEAAGELGELFDALLLVALFDAGVVVEEALLELEEPPAAGATPADVPEVAACWKSMNEPGPESGVFMVKTIPNANYKGNVSVDSWF